MDFGEPVGREQAGRRPAVVVSADPLNQGPAGVVVVVPLATAHRGLPSHVEIEAGTDTGLGETSYAKCEDVKSISDRRLLAHLGVASPESIFTVAKVLRYLLDL